MKIVNYVKQKDKNGCVIACGAMLTGKTYEQVKQDLREVYHDGIGENAQLLYLYHEGFFVRQIYQYNAITESVREWPPKPFAPVHWCRVLVSLDSSVGHAVLMDEHGKILDPLDGTKSSLSDYVKVYSVAGLWRPE